MKRNIASLLLVALVAALLMTACRPREDFSEIVEECANIVLPADEDAMIYGGALDAVGAYLDGMSSQASALSALDGALEELTRREDTLKPYSMPDGLSSLLKRRNIVPEEFTAFGEIRKGMLPGYLSDLSTLREYLENAEEFDFDYEDLRFHRDLFQEIERNMRGYGYYMYVNYWFADWAENELTAVRTKILNRLSAYNPAEVVWETERDVVEQKANSYLDMVEQYLEVQAQHTSDARENLVSLRKQYAEFQELVRIEEQLRKMYEINARLTALNEEIDAALEADNQERLLELREEFQALVDEYQALQEADGNT